MSYSTLSLWCDAQKNKLFAGWNQTALAQTPILKQGDKIGVEIHWIKTNEVGSVMQEVIFPPSASVALAVGRIDSAPTSGTFKLTYGATTTAALAYDISATNLQTALNTIPEITAEGGVTVTKSGTTYKIVWDDAGVLTNTLTCNTDLLSPTSEDSVVVVRAGTATVSRIVYFKLRQSAIAAQTSWTTGTAPTISVDEIFSKTWRVEFSSQPKGGVFSLTVTIGTTDYTVSTQRFDGSAGDMADSLNNIDVTLTAPFVVTKAGTNIWDISAPSEVVNITATNGLIGFSYVYATLDLNTVQVEEFLNGATNDAATLEVQVDIDGEVQTIIQSECVVVNDLIDQSSFNLVNMGDVMPVDSVVRWDTPQTISSGGQLQARTNIAAAGQPDIDALEAEDILLDGRLVVVEGRLNQDVKTTSDVLFNSARAVSASGLNGSRLYDGVVQGVTAATAPIASWTTGQRYALSSASGLQLYDATTNSSALTSSSLTLTSVSGSLVIDPAKVKFADLTEQTTAFIPADYLSKAGNLSGIANTSVARTNLGLGTMATQTAADYLTTATAATTYLSQVDAANTYAALDDSVSFTQVTVGDVLVSQVVITATGVQFPSTNEVQNIAHSAGTVQTGAGTNITNAAYPDEIEIVIGGTTYRVPARVI